MSSGQFVDVFYETNAGAVCPCRAQPETLTATFDGVLNASAVGPADNGFPSAKLRGGRSEIGITARKVRIKLPLGAAAPIGYSGDPLYIPIFTSALWAQIGKGDPVNYLGTGFVVSSKVPEYVN